MPRRKKSTDEKPLSQKRTALANARQRAVRALARSYDGEVFAHQILDELQQEDPLKPQDAALAAEVVIGVLRRRLTCEHIAAHFYRGRWEGLDISTRMVLATGVYQICWLDRVPNYAAVDEAVRLAKRRGDATGSLVNALLRKVVDCLDETVDIPAEPDPRRYLPLDGRRGRIFKENIFPDPAKRPLDFLIATTSHPAWLVERWHRRFKPRLCSQICMAGIRRPDLMLRPNRMRISTEDLLARLQQAGRSASAVPDSTAIRITDEVRITDLTEFHEGLCQPQDASSQIALTLSPPQPGEIVLDLCAGVGTKSTQAAEMMENRGRVIATDTDGDKLSQINGNAQRLGLTVIEPIPIDQISKALGGKSPDLILIDAPCLNTGVLARRPEARYRASQKSLMSIAGIQAGLLRQADGLAGKNTRIIYTTCSLEEEENERQIESFIKSVAGWRVAQQIFTLPDLDRDGSFAALLIPN